MKLHRGFAIVLGLILLSGCGGGGGSSSAAPAIEPIISKQVVIVPETVVAENLKSVSVDKTTLVFDETSPVVTGIKVGEVLSIPPSASAPDGMLRKVESIQTSGGQVELQTVEASLNEVIEQGSLNFSQTLQPVSPQARSLAAGVNENLIPGARMLTRSAIPGAYSAARSAGFNEGQIFTIALSGPEGGMLIYDADKNPATWDDQVWATPEGVVLYDADGDMGTTGDQVLASGSISFGFKYDLSAEWGFFKLKKMQFTATPWEMADITLTARGSINATYQKKIYEATFPRIQVLVGTFPVWLTPRLEVYLGCDGQVSVAMTTGAVQTASVTAGLKYDYSAKNKWSPISAYNSTFEYTPPEIAASLSATASIMPQFSLLIYGAGGPYVSAQAALMLDADINKTPWWSLDAGLYVGVGAKVEVMDKEIVNYYIDKVISYEKNLAVADGAFGSPPDTPLNLSATFGHGENTIAWDSVPLASSYNLYWSTNLGVTTGSAVIAGITSPYVHAGLTNGSTYYYTVAALNAAGSSLLSSEASATPEAAPVPTLWYSDTDGDSFGDPAASVSAVAQPLNYVASSADCDDTDSSINPGATEVYDLIDNNCNGVTDEGFTPTTWYYDADGDLFGDKNISILDVTQPLNHVVDSTDCNDADASIHPGATDIPDDGIDQDCSGSDATSGGAISTTSTLPDTGQTTCYDTAGLVINCAGTGQDGEFSRNPMSFTDNGNGTVIDNVTGLIWQQSDDDIIRTWTDAGSYCSTLTLGGSSTWRLPTRRELMSIVDYGSLNPTINNNYFPGTNSPSTNFAKYWSGTPVAGNGGYAWGVNFSIPYVDHYRKTSNYYARCAR